MDIPNCFIVLLYISHCISLQPAGTSGLRGVAVGLDMSQEIGDITYALKSLPINLPGLVWRKKKGVGGVSAEILMGDKAWIFFSFGPINSPLV